jgi:DNA-binding NarL/FixJ family response regulator
MLSEALDGHPALGLVVTEDGADLLISDRPVDTTDRLAVRRLDTGSLPAGTPAALILSLAHVLAAGVDLPPAGGRSEAAPPRLSPRERQVLELLVDGAPNKAIARALGISISTVKFHLAAVFEKLGARTRSEVVAVALREGLVGI